MAKRCAQLLREMPTSLLDDLQRLAAWEGEAGEASGHAFGQALAHYGGVRAATLKGVLGAGAGAGAGTGAGAGVEEGSTEDGSDTTALPAAEGSASVLPVIFRSYKKMILVTGAAGL